LDLDQYLGLFIDESKENLQILNENLLKLEKDPDNTEVLNEIFRVAHTFKGMSKTMGFNYTADLTHSMENLLEPLRSGDKKANSKIVDLLFSCLDKLENLIDSVIAKGSENENIKVDELVKELQSAITTKDDSAQSSTKVQNLEIERFQLNEYERIVVNEAISKGLEAREITVCIDNECVLPGVRSYMINSALENMGEILKYLPSVENIESGTFLTTDEHNFIIKILLVTHESDDSIKDKLLDISEIAKVDVYDLEKSAEKSEEKAQETNKTQSELAVNSEE